MTRPVNNMGARGHGSVRPFAALLGMFACLVGPLSAPAQAPPQAPRGELYSPTTWRRADTPNRHSSTHWTACDAGPSPVVPTVVERERPLLTSTRTVGIPSRFAQVDEVIPSGYREPTLFATAAKSAVQNTSSAQPPQVAGSGGVQPGRDRAKEKQADIPKALIFEPPTREHLFRLESEAALRKRMIAEAAQETPPEGLKFPEVPVLPPDVGTSTRLPAFVRLVEPDYVCHGPLLFEEKNSERYGWDLGPIQPFVSAGHFYGSTALLPWELMTAARRRYECSAGHFLPGTPIPYRWYLPHGLGWK